MDEFHDTQVALMVLIDAGASREDAALALLHDPAMVGRLAPQIAAKRDALEAEIEAEAQAYYEQTPEGIAERAFAAQEAREERAQIAAAARVLLEDEEGISTDGMSDDEVLRAAKIESKPLEELTNAELDEMAEHLAVAWDELSDHERFDAMSRLGTSKDALRSHREALGMPVDGMGLDRQVWSLEEGVRSVDSAGNVIGVGGTGSEGGEGE